MSGIHASLHCLHLFVRQRRNILHNRQIERPNTCSINLVILSLREKTHWPLQNITTSWHVILTYLLWQVTMVRIDVMKSWWLWIWWWWWWRWRHLRSGRGAEAVITLQTSSSRRKTHFAGILWWSWWYWWCWFGEQSNYNHVQKMMREKHIMEVS